MIGLDVNSINSLHVEVVTLMRQTDFCCELVTWFKQVTGLDFIDVGMLDNGGNIVTGDGFRTVPCHCYTFIS